jgi:hypothetical protein
MAGLGVNVNRQKTGYALETLFTTESFKTELLKGEPALLSDSFVHVNYLSPVYVPDTHLR